VGQQWVHFRNILHQNALRLEAIEAALCIGHTHQHHVGLAREGRDARQTGQCIEQQRALLADLLRLLREHPGVLQREQRALGVEHAHVVRRAQLVDFLHQRPGTHHVTDAHAGQAELGERAHEQHVGVGRRVGADLVEPAAAGKRLVGLVHHHQAAKIGGLGDQAADRVRVPEVGRGVVGVGDVGDGRLVLAHRRQHGGLVELEIGRERHADELQSLQLRAHGVHHETGQRRQHGGAGPVAGQGQQRDEFVRAIAQHQAAAGGQVHIARQGGLEVVDARAGVAVHGHRAQARAQRGLQRGRQRERVLHRVELDHAGGVLHGVGVHGLHVLADHVQRVPAHREPRIGGTSWSRNSAARAWACRPSP
jgi:hypothetical protein